MKEEESFDYTAWKAGQPLNTFRVVTGNNEVIVVNGHDANIDSPQPVLRLLVYSRNSLPVKVITGGAKNQKTETKEVEDTVGEISAAFNAGAWVSIVDQKYVKEVHNLDEKSEKDD